MTCNLSPLFRISVILLLLFGHCMRSLLLFSFYKRAQHKHNLSSCSSPTNWLICCNCYSESSSRRPPAVTCSRGGVDRDYMFTVARRRRLRKETQIKLQRAGRSPSDETTDRPACCMPRPPAGSRRACRRVQVVLQSPYMTARNSVWLPQLILCRETAGKL